MYSYHKEEIFISVSELFIGNIDISVRVDDFTKNSYQVIFKILISSFWKTMLVECEG